MNGCNNENDAPSAEQEHTAEERMTLSINDVIHPEVKAELPPLPEPLPHFPQHYHQTFYRFQEAISMGNEAEADRSVQECITLAETRGEHLDWILHMRRVLGIMLMDAKMYDSAKRHLTEVAKQRGGGRYVHSLAFCTALSGDIDGGFSLLVDEIDRTPSDRDVLLPAILVFLEHPRINLPSEIMFEKIDDLMNRVETEKPVDPRTIFALANYFVIRGNPERAISLLEEGLARDNLEDTWDSFFQINLAYIYFAAGQHTQAFEFVDKVLETESNNITLLGTTGFFLLDAGKPTEAIPVLLHAVELSNQSPYYRMGLAYALHLDGQTARSRQEFDVIRYQFPRLASELTKDRKAMYDALLLAHP